MKLFRTWSNWIDLLVFQDCYGHHYLLQERVASDTTRRFREIEIDTAGIIERNNTDIFEIVSLPPPEAETPHPQ